jgi:tetratricopeptide (TPR) repeat protein
VIDPVRILQPLDAATNGLEKLVDYTTPAELAATLQTAWDALDRSLRLWVRADAELPDSLRMAALSPVELPTDRLIDTLRQRKHISLEMAGMSHELARAAARSAQGDVRAGDADLARNTLRRLRSEVHAASEAPVRDAAHSAVETGMLEEAAQAVRPPHPRRSRKFWLIAAGALVALLALMLWIAPGGGDGIRFLSGRNSLEEGVKAFNAGRLGVAEQEFREVLSRNPDNVSALLYLGRVLRREGRRPEAAEALRRAAIHQPNDPDVRRELGNLLMDLRQPGAAAEQYRLAVNADPEEKLNWMGLVRALREAGSLQAAEQMLKRAPPEVQAALGT